MSKLDWGKVEQSTPDPAHVTRDRRDVSLSNTPTARKEAKQKAKARSKAAIRAASTRKANRDKVLEKERLAVSEARVREEADAVFWSRLKLQAAASNERRRTSKAQNAIGTLGQLVSSMLPKEKL